MAAIDFSKYNIQRPGAPVLPPAQGSTNQAGKINFAQYNISPNAGQTSAPVLPPAQQPTAHPPQAPQTVPGVNIAEGVAKGELSTAQGLGQLALKGTDALGITKNQGGDTFFKNSDTLKASNVQQEVGKAGEQVGEFFAAPEADIESIGAKAAEYADALPKAGQLAAKIGAKAAVRAVATAPIGAGQTGSLKGGAEAGGIAAISEPLAEILSAGSKAALPAVSDWIQKSSLRLTPVQIRDLGPKIDAVSKYLTDNNIIGTAAGRYKKVTSIFNGMEDTLQDALTKGAAKDVTIDKSELLDGLENLKSKYSNDRDVVGIERQIDDAKSALERQPDKIPVSNANQFKRSTFKNAYSKSGVKVLDTVEHDIGDTVYASIDKALKDTGVKISGKSLKDFNAEYSTVINAKKLLKAAASRKQAGFLAKLISSVAGSALGSFAGPVGEAIGAVAAPVATEALAGAPVRSALASGLSNVGKVLPKASARVLSSSAGILDKN